jgi:uncharacterized protein with PIN domain
LEPVVLCGDLNSRPGGVTHTYLSHGYINAKRIAPWYNTSLNGNDTLPTETTAIITSTTTAAAAAAATRTDKDDITPVNDVESGHDIDSDSDHVAQSTDSVDTTAIVNGLNNMNLLNAGMTTKNNRDDTPPIRYLLDASLNKLCRWLRILGQDVALETDEEEKLRTGKGEMVIFDRCKNEHRTLVTTSPRLMQRRDCPTSVYCIHPPYLSHLDVVMVHMLLSHGVELCPSKLLSRCVVCNGNIVEEHDDTRKRQILTEYEAPHVLIDEGMAVFICDGCQQGYWWNERPTSSASRVKTAATRLLELCVRAGVPIHDDDDDDGGMFDHVNYDQLREEGWDYDTSGSELLRQKLDVIEWLKADHLTCPFSLESAYLDKSDDNESLPFTNITHHFVDTLDYIFFDKTRLFPIERLDVPKSFEQLSDGRTHIVNSHLLPSDVWPSDHLALAVLLAFVDEDETNQLNKSVLEPVRVMDNAHESEQLQDKIEDNSVTECKTNVKDNSPANALYCGLIDSDALPPPDQMKKPQDMHVNNQRCLCGCIPPIPSLFEMAELRKKAKLKVTT